MNEATEPAGARATATRSPAPWHRRVGGLHVLKVGGSYYDMGLQHGQLLRDAVRRGPLPYYRTYVERLLGGGGPLGAVAWTGIQRVLGRRIERALPEFARETLAGLAEGAGLPLEEVVAGAVMPDALVWVVNRVGQVSARRAVAHRAALGLGCTSALAWGSATVDGELLHARNFDYHGVATWPEAAAVIFHEPEGALRYVSVSAAGVPLGGVTAMNEAGLTLAVHQHMFTDGARLGGTPIGLVGDLVMRQATSLDEAEAILAAHRPIGCWTYLVGCGRRRELLCWEEDPRRRARLRMGPGGGAFGYANVYLDPALGRTERALYGSYWRHNAGRHRRVRELLDGATGLGPAGMAAILADTGDGACRLHQAIAMLMTVGSVVFRPADGAVWVGTGDTPTSHGAFVPFSLEREDHAPELGELAPGPDDEHARGAFDRYRLAYLAYLDERDEAKARRLLDEARALRPGEPLYHALAGFLALRAGDAAPAEEAFTRALGLGHPSPERRASFHLWRGRARDMSGRRAAARDDYRAALALEADPPVRRAARRGLWRRYAARRAKGLAVDFAFADVARP